MVWLLMLSMILIYNITMKIYEIYQLTYDSEIQNDISRRMGSWKKYRAGFSSDKKAGNSELLKSKFYLRKIQFTDFRTLANYLLVQNILRN